MIDVGHDAGLRVTLQAARSGLYTVVYGEGGAEARTSGGIMRCPDRILVDDTFRLLPASENKQVVIRNAHVFSAGIAVDLNRARQHTGGVAPTKYPNAGEGSLGQDFRFIVCYSHLSQVGEYPRSATGTPRYGQPGRLPFVTAHCTELPIRIMERPGAQFNIGDGASHGMPRILEVNADRTQGRPGEFENRMIAAADTENIAVSLDDGNVRFSGIQLARLHY